MEPGGTARRSCAGRWCKRVGLGLGGYLLVGNLMLLGASVALQVAGPEGERPVEAAGIDHLRVVDERLWRGGAPTQEGYEALAANGVTTIVDLRAAATPAELEAPRELGFEVFHLPVHDGQTPSSALVQRARRHRRQQRGPCVHPLPGRRRANGQHVGRLPGVDG